MNFLARHRAIAHTTIAVAALGAGLDASAAESYFQVEEFQSTVVAAGAVPEPSSLALLSLGPLSLGCPRLRRAPD